MDRISTMNWVNSFRFQENRILHNSIRYSEIVMKYDEPGLVSGTSHIIKIPGILLTITAINPSKPLLITDSNESESIQSAFVMNGCSDSAYNSINRTFPFEQNNHAFQYSPSFNSEHKIYTENFTALHLNYELDFFKSLIFSSDIKEYEHICNCLTRKENFLVVPTTQVFALQLNELYNAVSDIHLKDVTRYMYIESKLIEILALQMKQIFSGNRQIDQIGRQDKEKLCAMKDYIEKNYLSELTLTMLSRMFTLNEFKVKRGYKYLFGTTVFAHIIHLRMQKANQLLREKNMNISEIADFIGYKNTGSFTNEFKKRFGFAPSQAEKFILLE